MFYSYMICSYIIYTSCLQTAAAEVAVPQTHASSLAGYLTHNVREGYERDTHSNQALPFFFHMTIFPKHTQVDEHLLFSLGVVTFILLLGVAQPKRGLEAGLAR
jgi:hypothetical protein